MDSGTFITIGIFIVGQVGTFAFLFGKLKSNQENNKVALDKEIVNMKYLMDKQDTRISKQESFASNVQKEIAVMDTKLEFIKKSLEPLNEMEKALNTLIELKKK